MRARAEYSLLASAPGIGQVLATTILLETGPIERFAAAGNFASYARCVDSVHSSNGKKKGESNTKNGNKYLAWALEQPGTNHGFLVLQSFFRPLYPWFENHLAGLPPPMAVGLK